MDASQLRIVVREDNSHSKRAANEEDAKAKVNSLEGDLEVNAGVFGLCWDHRDIVGPYDDEDCSNEGSQEAFEPSEHSDRTETRKSSRVTPVVEAVSVALGVASDHCDEGEGKQNENEDNLAP